MLEELVIGKADAVLGGESLEEGQRYTACDGDGQELGGEIGGAVDTAVADQSLVDAQRQAEQGPDHEREYRRSPEAVGIEADIGGERCGDEEDDQPGGDGVDAVHHHALLNQQVESEALGKAYQPEQELEVVPPRVQQHGPTSPQSR